MYLHGNSKLICTTIRFHHDIESYKIPKPLILEGIGKVKDAVSSYLSNHQGPEAVEGVNLVSDAIDVLKASSLVTEEAIATGTV